MRTEFGFVPSKGIMCGISVPLRKSKKVCPLTDPITVSTAIIPLDVSAAMALTLTCIGCVTGVVL